MRKRYLSPRVMEIPKGGINAGMNTDFVYLPTVIADFIVIPLLSL